MKKNIFLIVFAIALMGFEANAQTCCKKSETTKEACCSKPSTTSSSTAKLQEQTTTSKMTTNLEHTNQETFKVYGNCMMCKKRIEGALSKVKGIHSAVWDTETKILTVSFEKETISLEQIHKEITKVGHDTDKDRAEDSVYDKLPGCCKYDRAKI